MTGSITDVGIIEILNEIAYGREISEGVNPPYLLAQYGGDCRLFDKVYVLGGLTVYAEAELGTKLNRGNKYKYPYSGEDVNIKQFLVTPKNQETYEKELKKKLNIKDSDSETEKFVKAFNQEKVHYIDGPLVDNQSDIGLKTIRVKRVLAEYTGADLGNFMKDIVWNKFIEHIKEKHSVDIEELCKGIISDRRQHPPTGLTSPLRNYSEGSKVPLVFRKEIDKKDDLSNISSVCRAGLALEHAHKGEVERLMEMYLR